MDNLHKNYLEHHGILGMKWGRRQGPPYPLDASDHSAAEKKAGYKKSLGGGRNESEYERGQKRAKKEKENYSESYLKKKAQTKEDKLKKKIDAIEKKKKAVSDYEKAFDKASELSDKSDDMFNEAKKQYKALGKTLFSRINEVSKAQKGKGSAAANKYIKTWDEAERLGNEAAEAWKESDRKYAKLGKTYAARVFTSIKYGSPIVSTTDNKG